jgi:hypothetical protein
MNPGLVSSPSEAYNAEVIGADRYFSHFPKSNLTGYRKWAICSIYAAAAKHFTGKFDAAIAKR